MGGLFEMTTIIQWKPVGMLPENASYILIRYFDAELEECTFGFGSFENGVYSLLGAEGNWHDLKREDVLGWSYPIYEKRSR